MTEDTSLMAPSGVTDDLLTTEEKRRLFVQVAALFSMDEQSIFSFGKNFLFSDDVKKKDVKPLIDRYKKEIVNASSIINLYISERGFDCLTVLKQAEMINTGISTVDAQMKVAQTQIRSVVDNNKEEETYWKRLDQLARRTSTLMVQYKGWVEMKDSWVKTVEGMMFGEGIAEQNGSSAGLDVRKVSSVMKRNGVMPDIADRVAGLIVSGDVFVGGAESNSKYFVQEITEEDAEFENMGLSPDLKNQMESLN